MKKISVLMLLAFSMLTFGAFAQAKPVSKSATHTVVAVKKHPKKHAKKHKAVAAKTKK